MEYLVFFEADKLPKKTDFSRHDISLASFVFACATIAPMLYLKTIAPNADRLQRSNRSDLDPLDDAFFTE
jgi:hypothetical protein